MSEVAIKVENLSKQYRLGLVGAGTLGADLNRWWAGVRGKEDPFLKIGETNDRSQKGGSDYVWSLRDINFEVEHGEVLGIIGKNGAGKSTLLKILSKVTGPTTGRIMAKGRIGSLLEVGTGFHPELTGRENIFLNGAILGMKKFEITAKLDEIIEFSGCERYIDTPTKRYSSGMTVRLGFAIAAFLEPEILIVDEVLAVGDAEFQKKAIGKLKDVSYGEGRTVLFVSHDMMAIQKLCSRVIVLNNGEIVFNGNPTDAISSYLDSGDVQSAFGTIGEGVSRNKYNEGYIDLRSIYLETMEGHRREVFGYSELINLSLEFEVLQEVPDGELLISFGNKEVDRITFSSNSEEGEPLKLSKGINHVEIALYQNLLPGYYMVHLGILNGEGYPYDAVTNFGQFEILKKGKELQYKYHRNIGLVRMPMEIRKVE